MNYQKKRANRRKDYQDQKDGDSKSSLPMLGNSQSIANKDVFQVNGAGSRRGRKSSLVQSSIEKPQTIISSNNYGSNNKII
jgi:hypothetical protein